MEDRNEYNRERLDRQQRVKDEAEQQKIQRKAYINLVASVKSDCGKAKDKSGLLAVKYKLEYIENGGQLPAGFAKSTAVEAYKEGISQYENEQARKNEQRKEKGL